MELATQEDLAYEHLRNMVLRGELPKGQFLSQRKLAEEAGAAVITVRGALRRLENDGLIESVPRWGVRVPVEAPEGVRDRYFMREILEVAAVRYMCTRWTPDQATKLREMAHSCDACEGTSDEDIDRFSRLHQRLHLFAAECTGSRRLLTSLSRLLTIGFVQTNARRAWARGRDRSPNHHQALAETFLLGDPEPAERAMREHAARGLKFELETLNAE